MNPTNPAIFKDETPLVTIPQLIAKTNEDFKLFSSSLHLLKNKTLKKIHGFAEHGLLRNFDKHQNMFDVLTSINPSSHGNALWKIMSPCPPSIRHFKNSVLGKLIQDLNDGVPDDKAILAFNEYTSPENYQRPSSFSEGNAKRADEIIEKMGWKESFRRRYATVFDLKAVWEPSECKYQKQENVPGMFSNVIKKKNTQKVSLDLGTKRLTMRKFLSEYMARISSMKMYFGHSFGKRYPFMAFTTESIRNSPPIIKWDKEELRNPVAWYFYIYGSTLGDFNLDSNSWTTVNAIVPAPNSWNTNEDISFFTFVLKNCKDRKEVNLSLFPEILRPELREIRSSVEAYSNANKLEMPIMSPPAAGISFKKTDNFDIHLKVVYRDGNEQEIIIDRWD